MSIVLKTPSNGSVTLAEQDTASDVTVTIPAVTATMLNDQSNIEAQSKTALNASGSAPIYACRAWVNFNGTGTPAIRASGNVSSITDNGTGDYTVNFTTAMSDVNYSIVGSVGSGDTFGSYAFVNPGAGSRFVTGSCRINSFITQTAGLSDVDTVCVSIFR